VWLLVLSLALGAAALVSTAPMVALALAAAPLAPTLLYDGRWRVLAVAFGGVTVFHSSEDLSVLKAIYVVLLVLVLAGAWSAVSHATRAGLVPTRVARSIAAATALLLGVVALSAPVALMNGHPFDLWFRDASPYVLLSMVPLLAVDASLSTSKRFLTWVFIAAGLVATASFAVFVLFRRGTDVSIENLALSSFFLSSALFAFAWGQALAARRRSLLGWGLVAGIVFGTLLVTGTRSVLLLLFVPLTIWLIVRGRGFGRLVKAAIVATFAVVLGFLFVQEQAGITLATLGERLQMVESGLLAPEQDQSVTERLRESEESWWLFKEAPLVGVGPGHLFQSYRVGGVSTSFTVDSSLSVLAKFGALGATALIGFFGVLWHVVTRSGPSRLYGRAQLAAYATVTLLYFAVGNPFEDKGFAIGLVFLVAFALPQQEQKHHSPSEGGLKPGRRKW